MTSNQNCPELLKHPPQTIQQQPPSCFTTLYINLHLQSTFRMSSLLHPQPSLLSALRSLTLSSNKCISKSPSPISRAFSTTPSQLARKDDKKNKTDPRITLIRYHMQHPETPRPLKLSRMRALRHWTIHRAWMIMRRNKREREERELMRLVISPGSLDF